MTIALVLLPWSAKSSDFSASDYGIVHAWFSAGKGIELEDSKVIRWQSLQGSSELSPREGSSPPLFIAGEQPAVQFEPENNLSGQLGEDVDIEKTFIFVGRLNSGTVGQLSVLRGLFMLWYQQGLAVKQNLDILQVVTRFPSDHRFEIMDEVQRAEALEPVMSIPADSAGMSIIVAVVMSLDRTAVYVNGQETLLLDYAVGFAMKNPPIAVGSYAVEDAAGANALVNEAILYATALEPKNRMALEDALSKRYGIALNR